MTTPDTDGRALALGTKDTARALGISRSRLFELLREKEGPRSFLLGRRRLFPVSEIRVWLAKRIAAEHADKGNAHGAD